MGTVIVAEVGEEGLGFATGFSDRFVYSNYYVPVLITFDDGVTPVLPFYTKQAIVEALRYGGLDGDRLPGILKTLGLGQLWRSGAAIIVDAMGQDSRHAQ